MLRDFKFILKTPVLLISLLVVSTLPFIYAITFLGAMWNPYENTEDMKFNIVNEDKGTEDINVGDSLVDELKEEDRLDWQFTDLDTAKKALQKGETYGYIVIPEDASEKAMSFLTEDPEQVEMSLNLNPGHNFIGALMSEQVGHFIIEEVRKEITDNYITAIVDQLDSVESDSQDAQEAIQQLSDGANELNNGLIEAHDASGQLVQGANELNDGVGQLNNGANELSDGTGQLVQGEQQMTAQLQQLAQMVGPQGQQLVQAQSQLEQGAAQADGGANQLAQGASEAANGSNQLAGGISELNSGLGELQQGSQELSDSLNEINTQFKKVLDKIEEENLAFTESGAKYIAQPVHLETKNLVDTQNYGQSFAPLIVAISLFIGSITFNVVYPNNKIFDEDINIFKAWFGRMLLYMVHALLISTFITVVVDFIMQIEISSHWRFFLLNYVWSLLSITMIGALVTLFGNFGKFLSIILLIVQLSASGGTFPIETTNAIYQKLYEFLPMSYTVIGYRTAIFNQAFDHEFSTVIYVLLGMLAGAMLFILLLFFLKDKFPRYRALTSRLSRLEA